MAQRDANTEIVISPKAHAVPVALIAQSVHVLSQNAEALHELVSTFAISNPVVEFAYTDTYAPASTHGDVEYDYLSNVPAREDTLAQRLAFQLHTNKEKPDPAVLHAAWFIINSLDGDGYLREPLEELCAACGLPLAALERALELVQGLEPPGVAARSLDECLRLQLKSLPGHDHGLTALAIDIVNGHIEELAAGELCEESFPGHTREELARAEALIKTLDPRPGLVYDNEPTAYVRPDVKIEFDGDTARVLLINQPAAPVLSPMYRTYLGADDEAAREYVQESLAYARSFLYALEERAGTLVDITTRAAQYQIQYLKSGGRGGLKRLTLTSLAEGAGLSLSTVSRAVNAKYAQCEGRVFPLRELFTAGGSGETSREEIVARIGEILSEGTVYSDERLRERLAAQGIRIARRTVNKYRRIYLDCGGSAK